MVSRTTQKHQKVPWIDPAFWGFKGIALVLGTLVIGVLIVFAGIKLKQAQPEYLPAEFEGRITDRWIGIGESDQGSYHYYRLLVEIEGQPRTVPVTHEIYEEAQVGRRLRRSEKGLEVIREPQRQ